MSKTNDRILWCYFKKFNTRIDAENFIDIKEKESKYDVVIEDYELEIKNDLNSGRVVVFTDGSFSGGEQPTAGYGCLILTPEGKRHEISNKVHTERYIDTNNIAPEVFAILESLKWAISNEYSAITIYHDLELIGKWVNGTYKANSEIGQLLLRELNEKYNIVLDIGFKWVPSHSGVAQNERADELARNAVTRQKPISKYGKNSFMGRGVDKINIDAIIDEFKNYPSIKYSIIEDNEKQERHVFNYNSEKLTVSYFKKTGTLLLQGKVQSLFAEFLSEYTVHIEDFEMIKAYSESFKQTIKNSEVEELIKSYKLPDNYPKDIITLLKQSHVFLGLNREEYDYSHYPMPAFRALEGHFKFLAAKEGVVIPLHVNVGSLFYYSKEDSCPKWRQNNKDAKKLQDSNFSDKLQEIQIFLITQRNPLSHFGSITQDGQGNAKMIENIEEAKDIIKETINLIVN